MKLFKKGLVLVLALMMLLCVCACSQTTDDAKDTTPNTAPTGSSNPATQPSSGTNVTPDDQVQYKIKVTDDAGNPMVGVYVQLCTEEICLAPVKTDDAGVAILKAADDEEYHAKITKVPSGYETDTVDFYFEDGETELTIVLKVIAG